MLEVASVETADSGDYICSATATDSSDSQYVLSSEPASATATVTVSKSSLLLHTSLYYSYCCSLPHLYCVYCTELSVRVTADYRPAGGEGELGPNLFTAGSLLSLNCSVQGHSGNLSYSWSVRHNSTTPDCYSCDVDTSSTDPTLTVGNPHLFSYYAGVYTCTVNETGRSASTNSEDFTVTVVGE